MPIVKKMINKSDIKVGDKVYYIPFDGCDASKIENGMVKEIPDYSEDQIRVVFHCAGDWENFNQFISQLTPLDKLEKGWK